MSLLKKGLNSIEQGEGKWRVTINHNLESIYTTDEVSAIVDGKANSPHYHSDYFPLASTLSENDVVPILGELTSDVVFNESYGMYLVDRANLQIVGLSINSGNIVVTGTGVFLGVFQGAIDVNTYNMVASYTEIVNGEVV